MYQDLLPLFFSFCILRKSARRSSRRVKRPFLSEKSQTHKNSLAFVKGRTGTVSLLPGFAVSSRSLLTLHFIALTHDTNQTLIDLGQAVDGKKGQKWKFRHTGIFIFAFGSFQHPE